MWGWPGFKPLSNPAAVTAGSAVAVSAQAKAKAKVKVQPVVALPPDAQWKQVLSKPDMEGDWVKLSRFLRAHEAAQGTGQA